MATSQLVDEVGCWKKEKVLGAGGFGYVVLWRNKETNEPIALKECRWGNDPMMTPKHRSRWKLEVDMMFRLNHQNVVKAIPVPPELDVPPTELPILAMEFCSNGDLRKLLSKPENCCGLKEKHVRLIMKHISSAVNYLHSMRIIHRDLKPENIVIQSQNGSVVYKLIDLGYAKELDQGSLCTSFVGTLQYLAPELFMSREYSCTVDYWSLGLVTHEIITGSRPFLPDKSPAEWIPIIRQKTSTQIRAYLDEDKNIIFSSEISPFNYISKTFKEDVEKYLQLMLDWDPKKRGRNGNTTFFSFLETILNKKVALVFCVETLKLHSFPISEELTFKEFAKLLEIETNIPVDQQEILLPNGHLPDSNKGAKQFLANLEEEEYIITLLDSNATDSSLSPSSVTSISPDVESMMRNPHAEIEYMRQRSVWSEAVHLCQQEYIRVSRVLQAFKASVINLSVKASAAHKNVSRMTEEMNILMAECTFFQSSLQKDIRSCEEQNKKYCLNSHQMLEDWKENLENLKKIELLGQKVCNLEACSANITSHAVELHKSPYARSKIAAPIEEVYGKILESFSELKRRPKEQRRIPHDNTDFVRLLCMCLQHSHTLIQELLSHIRKVKKVQQDMNDFQPQFIALPYEIAEWKSEVKNWQFQRQREIWKLISDLNKKIHKSDDISSVSPLSCSPQTVAHYRRTSGIGQLMPLRYSPDPARCSPDSAQRLVPLPFPSTKPSPPIIVPQLYQSRIDTLTLTSSLSKDENSCNRLSIDQLSLRNDTVSLSSILDQTSKDNKRVKKENQDLVESFRAVMSMLQSYKDTDTSDTMK